MSTAAEVFLQQVISFIVILGYFFFPPNLIYYFGHITEEPAQAVVYGNSCWMLTWLMPSRIISQTLKEATCCSGHYVLILEKLWVISVCFFFFFKLMPFFFFWFLHLYIYKKKKANWFLFYTHTVFSLLNINHFVSNYPEKCSLLDLRHIMKTCRKYKHPLPSFFVDF